MARIRTRKQRDEATRAAIDAAIRATGGQVEPTLPKVTITLHVAGHGEQEPRIPRFGVDGAIRGSVPHQSRLTR